MTSAYAGTGVHPVFIYAHALFAIIVYLPLYLSIFGREEVKWMLINSSLGIFGIYSQMDWMVSLLGSSLDSYPLYVNIVPFLYYIMYTFLFRQLVLDVTGSRESSERRKVVERYYVVLSVLVYGCVYFLK